MLPIQAIPMLSIRNVTFAKCYLDKVYYCYRLKDEVRIKVKQSLHVRRTRFIYTNV